jgi:glycerophosphoryl diester phosphodiesterase
MSAWLTFIAAVAGCSSFAATLIAAHRGGLDAPFPENTMPAFHHARQSGAQLVELDLRATADGQIVVLHDRSVDRTTNGRGLIHEMTLADVQALDAGDSNRIPTLQEVLAWAMPLEVGLLLDVKRAPDLPHARIVNAVVKAGLESRVLFGIRSLTDLEEFSRHAAGLRFLGLVPKPQDVDAFVAAGVEGIRLWPKWLRSAPELVPALQAQGVSVWLTAGDANADAVKTYAAKGVQGLITDRPAVAASALGCEPATAEDNTP